MANQITPLNYANTFGDWMVATNAVTTETNTLGKSNYTKDSGTLILNETTQNALRSNGVAVFQNELKVQGVGSSATIQNDLTVTRGQVYFSNTELGLINAGQANIGGLLHAQGSGIGLLVANSALVSGNTTIAYNTVTNYLQSNNQVTTGIVQANTFVVTDVVQANSQVTTGIVQANTEIITDVFQANTQVTTGIVQANTFVVTDVVQANSQVTTGTVQANNIVVTAVMQANNRVVTAVMQANSSVITDTVYANTLINTTEVRSTQLNTSTLSVSTTSNVNTLKANTSIETPALTVTGTKLDATNADARFNSATVQGKFTVNGTIVYNTPRLTVSAETPNQDSYLGTYRTGVGSPTANAYLRWNETQGYWDATANSTSGTYYRILTNEYLSSAVNSTSATTVATSLAANTLNNSIVTANNNMKLYVDSANNYVVNYVNTQVTANVLNSGAAVVVAQNFSSTTTDSDPGNGTFRFNAAVGSATFAYMDNLDAYGATITSILSTYGDSTNTVKGHLRFSVYGASTTKYAVFAITSSTAATGYYKIGLSYVAGAGSFTSGDLVMVQYSRAGNVGAQGAAATISVGTVTQGTLGVQNSGSSSAAVFNFSIPAGAQGAPATIAAGTVTQGALGVQNSGSSGAAVFNFSIPAGAQGVTGNAATVSVGTVTTGAAGTSASVTNSGSSSAATFNFTIPRGDKGYQGDAGAAATATVSVGTVTTGSAGSSASVTNSGSSSAATFNFTIPRGDKGDPGAQGPAGGFTTNSDATINSLNVYTSGAAQGEIRAYGNITAGISDQRLKIVEGVIQDPLNKISKLDGVYYTYNELARGFGFQSSARHVGLLAQQVNSILPEVTPLAPFDSNEKNESKSGETYLTIQYEKLVPLLVESIKQLNREVETLKKDVETLKNNK